MVDSNTAVIQCQFINGSSQGDILRLIQWVDQGLIQGGGGNCVSLMSITLPLLSHLPVFLTGVVAMVTAVYVAMATVVVHFCGNQLTICASVLKDEEVTVLNPAQVCAFGCSIWLQLSCILLALSLILRPWS